MTEAGFRIRAFIEASAKELNCSYEEIESMGKGAFIVASGPFERSEKRQYQEELERIRDAALVDSSAKCNTTKLMR